MADLVHGSYPLLYSFRKFLGLTGNVTQSNLSLRSNIEFPLFGSVTDAAASLVSGKATVVAVPVDVGDVISKVSIVAGATAESGGSHAWAAIYSGVATTAVLQGAQSADVTGATAIAASAVYAFTLATPVVVTSAIAPNGYIYVAVSVTGTVPSLSSGAVGTGVQYARATGAPPFLGGTYSSALGATAPATITLASVTAIATPPEVYLS